jgi:hypothetical protein
MKLKLTETLKAFRGKITLNECKRSLINRLSTYNRLKLFSAVKCESHLPSDNRDDENDVAFGITNGSIYLDANMVTGEEAFKKGLISHIALLIMGGLAKDENDVSDDYAVRGIVKPKLGGIVIFWEDNDELLRKHDFVKMAISKLLSRKIIDDKTEIWGANSPVMLARAYEIIDW